MGSLGFPSGTQSGRWRGRDWICLKEADDIRWSVLSFLTKACLVVAIQRLL
jgi:hypothetical protein